MPTNRVGDYTRKVRELQQSLPEAIDARLNLYCPSDMKDDEKADIKLLLVRRLSFLEVENILCETRRRMMRTEVGKPVVRKKNPRFQRKKVLIAGLAGKIGGKVKVGSPLAH